MQRMADVPDHVIADPQASANTVKCDKNSFGSASASQPNNRIARAIRPYFSHGEGGLASGLATGAAAGAAFGLSGDLDWQRWPGDFAAAHHGNAAWITVSSKSMSISPFSLSIAASTG